MKRISNEEIIDILQKHYPNKDIGTYMTTGIWVISNKKTHQIEKSIPFTAEGLTRDEFEELVVMDKL